MHLLDIVKYKILVTFDTRKGVSLDDKIPKRQLITYMQYIEINSNPFFL